MKKKNIWLFFAVPAVLTAGVIVSSFQVKVSPPAAFSQKLTLNRLMNAPLLTLQKQLGRLEIGVAPANASIQGHYAKASVDECTSPSNVQGLWNDMLSCFFVQYLQFYNNFTAELARSVNPDGDFSANDLATDSGGKINIVSKASTVTGYTRHIEVTDSATGNICLLLEYAKGTTDTSTVKAYMFFDTTKCGVPASSGKVAMAMKFDLKYTDALKQAAEFFVIFDSPTTSTLDLTSEGDALLHMVVNVDETTGVPITKANSVFMGGNLAYRLAVAGQDDVKLTIGGTMPTPVALTNTDTSASTGTGWLSLCADDSSASGSVTTGCATADNFTESPNSLRSKTLPTWTPATLTVSESASPQSYFP